MGERYNGFSKLVDNFAKFVVMLDTTHRRTKSANKNPSFLAERGAIVSPYDLASCELQLSEVLDGANHLRGVGVFVW